MLVEGGVTRVSLGAQSFQPHLLATLDRRATPDRVVQAVTTLREAGVTNLNLDLMFGVPGQTAADLAADLDQASSLEPDHISYYELEAKPGTRFTHRHGAELERQAEALERPLRDGRGHAPASAATTGTRRPTSAATATRRATTWPTGRGATTSAWASGAVSTIGLRAAPQPAVPARLPGGGGGGSGAARRDRAAEPRTSAAASG